MSSSLFFILALILFFPPPSLTAKTTTTTTTDRFIKAIPPSLRQNATQEYIELTRPLPTDHLTPSCSLQLLRHNFSNTIGRPPVTANYSPPADCPPPWTSLVLEMRVSSKGDQYDRIAAVWLAGAEILRTSTAEPTEEGIFWKIRKDVSRYASLFQKSNLTLTVMLENVVNDEFTGVYHVNLTLLYYNASSIGVPTSRKSRVLRDYIELNSVNSEAKLGFGSNKNRDHPEAIDSVIIQRNSIGLNSVNNEAKLGFGGDKNRDHQIIQRNCIGLNAVNNEAKLGFGNYLGFYENPADLIEPISNNVQEEGFWFRIESESGIGSRNLEIPPNTHKAVLEVYVSFHGNDEFWYSNPPDSYIRSNNLTTGRGHGAYREVFLTIDGNVVGSVHPIPIIFTGGINPLFWEPVVAIGAFDLPSYDFDLTPFLGLVLDGKAHSFGIGVSDSISFWLVDANLHLWLDGGSSKVEAGTVAGSAPAPSIKRSSKSQLLDGKFKIKAKRKNEFVGWVASSAGNLTTRVSHKIKFKNTIRFEQNGTYKSVHQKVTTKTEVTVESETGGSVSRVKIKRYYPLTVITSTQPGLESDAYMAVTNVSHSLKETVTSGDYSSSLLNDQVSEGWMKVKDHSVLNGSGTTDQSFSSVDESGCYSRNVSATDGRLVIDNVTLSCTSAIQV